MLNLKNAQEKKEGRFLGIQWQLVALALGSSTVVFCLWSTILTIEAHKNGMTFVEYVTVVFQVISHLFYKYMFCFDFYNMCDVFLFFFECLTHIKF